MSAALFQCPEGLGWDCHMRHLLTKMPPEFQCPEGLGWDCHPGEYPRLAMCIASFSAPRGLVGIVTSSPDGHYPGVTGFQCPEGLGWDCHSVRAAVLTGNGFSAPRGLVGIVTAHYRYLHACQCHVSVPRGAWLGLSPLRLSHRVLWAPYGLVPRGAWLGLSPGIGRRRARQLWVSVPRGAWLGLSRMGMRSGHSVIGFSAPRGLVGIVTSSGQSRGSSCHSCFSAPRGLVGIVTDFIASLRAAIKQLSAPAVFQCPEGLGWDCHRWLR